MASKHEVPCPTCSTNLARRVVEIWSNDDKLMPYSGIYCPRCLFEAFEPRIEEFEVVLEGYDTFRRGLVA